MSLHTHWRDCKEWEEYGIKLGTTNNEAAKLYDAAVSQNAGMYNDASVGGLEATVRNIISSDPDFVMGHVLANWASSFSGKRSFDLESDYKVSVNQMKKLSQRPGVNEWEKMHADAAYAYCTGSWKQACDILKRILMDYPLDFMAIKYLYFGLAFMGLHQQFRDTVAMVMPYWTPHMPHYGNMSGMYALTLGECNQFQQAERIARQRSDMLQCHIFWHLGLYHIELGSYQAALDVYDSHIWNNFKQSGALYNMVDATSFLKRLEVQGVDVGGRWKEMYDLVEPYSDKHGSAWLDVHIMMALMGAGQQDKAKAMMQSIQDYIRESDSHTSGVLRSVGQPICKAFRAYEDGDYAKAVDTLFPIRYDIINLGGSYAQRDEFNVFLIDAALRSSEKKHNKLAKHLLYERRAIKGNSCLTERMMERALAAHSD